jgi:hypothetical protein
MSADILFERELAARLRTSVSTIKRRLAHAPHLLPPTAPSIDRRPRWFGPTVDAWLAEPARTAPTFNRKRGGWR